MRYSNTVVKNIFYMLSYAFQELQRQNYESLGREDFEYIEDLMAEILYRGVSLQMKQGFHREYIDRNEDISTVKGRIDMAGTMRLKMANNLKLYCSFDELSENIPMNQIIKSTFRLLIYSKKVDPIRKNKIKGILPLFSEVDCIEPKQIRWDTLQFDRSLGTYRMLVNICYLTINGMLHSSEEGKYKTAIFDDKNFNRLYEKFILNYYKIEHSSLTVSAGKVNWDITDNENKMIELLPDMNTDITLGKDGKTLIIDAKRYKSMYSTNELYNSKKISSGHLYQIYTYVKNFDKEHTGDVSGMLLYAKTENEEPPSLDAVLGGNRIMVKALDLNQDFTHIRAQLDKIAKEI